MEHAEGVAIGVKQKLVGFNILERAVEIDEFTSNIKVVVLLLDGIYSLLLTKYGEVTVEIVSNLNEYLGLLWQQWVKMQLPMTPKFHCLLLHAVRQLIATNGGIGDMGEDGIERSHQERWKDTRRMTGLKEFQRRTNSQTMMQHIRVIKEVKELQHHVEVDSKIILKRPNGLADTNDTKKRKERNAKRAKVVCEVKEGNKIVQKTGRERNLEELAAGQQTAATARQATARQATATRQTAPTDSNAS